MASTTQRKSHRTDFKATNLRLTSEAAGLLEEVAQGPKAHGQFVSDLIVDFYRRQGFRDFYEKESRRQMRRLAKDIQREISAAKACE